MGTTSVTTTVSGVRQYEGSLSAPSGPSRVVTFPNTTSSTSLSRDMAYPRVDSSNALFTQALTPSTSIGSLAYASAGTATPVDHMQEDPWQAMAPAVTMNDEFASLRNSEGTKPVSIPDEYLRNAFNASKHSVGSQLHLNKQQSSAIGETTRNHENTRTFEPVMVLDTVSVHVSPEMGGFVFKHVNYTLMSKHHLKSVTRRYSDFLWLFDVLIKRYPFRMLPSLPPKKAVGVDQAFIERRRKGLVRFINYVANHPVMRLDSMVLAFLTFGADMYTFRQKKEVILEEEFSHSPLTDAMKRSIPSDVLKRIGVFRGSVGKRVAVVSDMARLAESIVDRVKQTSVDVSTCANLVSSDSMACSVTDGCSNDQAMAEGFVRVSGCLHSLSAVYDEQQRITSDGFIEALKTHRDLVVAAHELLVRTDKALSLLTMEATQLRIQQNQDKLVDLVAKGATSAAREIERLSLVVEQDQRELEHDVVRAEIIHFCVWQEMQFYHRSKDRLAIMCRDLAKDQLRFHRQFIEVITCIYICIVGMPASLTPSYRTGLRFPLFHRKCLR